MDYKKLSDLTEYLTYDDVLLLPNYSEVRPSETDISVEFANGIRLALPIIASPMDTVCEARLARKIALLGGVGIIHRNLTIEDQVEHVGQVLKEKLLVGGAIGVGSDSEERLRALVEAHVPIICIDSSHGFTKHVIELTKMVKKKYPRITLISGNVATYEGALALFKAGADTVRVGMGPGSICTTRVMSGMGVPQLTAVSQCLRAAREMKKTIIADGGIKTSGDMVKAFAIGARTVMLGSLLAGTDESPGEVIELDGKLYKTYRGMGSVGAMKKGSAARYGQKWEKGKTKELVPEGVEGLVTHRGGLEEHIHQLVGGIRAGMGYLGSKNLVELEKNARFIKISQSALIESHPHSLLITNPGKNYAR